MSSQKSLENVLKSKIHTMNNLNTQNTSPKIKKNLNNTSHLEESIIDNISVNDNRLFSNTQSLGNNSILRNNDFQHNYNINKNCITENDLERVYSKIKKHNICLFITLFVFNILLIGINNLVLFYYTNITWN